MGKFLDRFKNADKEWDEWEEESVDWDEELGEAVAYEAKESDGFYEEDADYEDIEFYEDDGVYEDDVVYEDDGVYEDDVVYEDDGVYEDDVVYADDDVYEDDVVYEDDDAYEDDVVYEDDGTYEDDIVYEDDVVSEEDTVYTADIEYEDDIVYEDDAVYEDDIVYEDDMVYEDELYADGYEEDDEEENGIVAWFANMTGMDKVMLATGVGVLLLAIATLVVFMGAGNISNQSKVFASVGTQLEGIEIVGDEGLLALSDAVKNKAAEEELQEVEKDYGEAEYNKDVTVTLKTASVQKDLKIKFVNKSSEKLIANVPFTVSVTAPDGKSETWSDDDMDGIIHKKGITPGNYKLDVNELSGEKYASYEMPGSSVSAEVRKDIAYQKVDVSDEVKTEDQIDVSNEEQKKQNPQEESGLEDTVEWVESTEVTNTYVEVPKSKITDPSTSAKSGSFMRMAAEVNLDKESAELKVGGDSLTLKGSYTDIANVIAESWSSSDNSIAEVDTEGVVTAVSAGKATITYTVIALENGEEKEYEATCEVTVTDELATPFDGTITVDSSVVTLAEGAESKIQTSVSGFEEDRTLAYTVSSADEGIAKASVNKKGKVTITAVSAGTTNVTVSVNYKEDPVANAPSIVIEVTVTEKGSVSLDKKELTVIVGSTATITASAGEGAEISASSSDEEVATVKADGTSIVVTGVKEGTATVTVKAKKGEETVKAKCAVTVKADPKNDTKSKLKDNDGNQLYVQENDEYREAVYADYYKEGVQFFKKGETKYTGWQTIDGKVYFFDKNGKKVTGEQVIQGAKYTFDSDGVLMCPSITETLIGMQ